jgi:cell division septation protein DedD
MRWISGFILTIMFAVSVGLGFSMGQTVRFKVPPPATALAPGLTPLIDGPDSSPRAADPLVLIPRAAPLMPAAVAAERTPSLPDVMTPPPGSALIDGRPAVSSAQAPAPVFLEGQHPSALSSLPDATEPGVAASVGSYSAIPPGGSEPATTARTAPQRAVHAGYATAPFPAQDFASGPRVMRYHVQVGIFNNWQEAEALSLRLKALGYAVKVTGGGSLYRVWVGGHLDQSTAQRLAQNLQKVGFEATLAQ